MMLTLPLVEVSSNWTRSKLKYLSAPDPLSQLVVALSQLLPFVPCHTSELEFPVTVSRTYDGLPPAPERNKLNVWRVLSGIFCVTALQAVELVAPSMRSYVPAP